MDTNTLRKLALTFDEHGYYELAIPDVMFMVAGTGNDFCANTVCVDVNSVCGDGELPDIPNVHPPGGIDKVCGAFDQRCMTY